MIIANDFAKWLAIFNVYHGGVTPPPAPGPGGNFVSSQVITVVSGITGAAVKDVATWTANTTASGGVVTVTTSFKVAADNSGNPLIVNLSCPVNPVFGSSVTIAGAFNFQKVINPANGDGNFQTCVSNGASQVQLTFAVAVPGVQYQANMVYSYVIT
jgi:hypothetical protein